MRVNFVQLVRDAASAVFRDEISECRGDQAASGEAQTFGKGFRRNEKFIRQGNSSFHTMVIPKEYRAVKSDAGLWERQFYEQINRKPMASLP